MHLAGKYGVISACNIFFRYAITSTIIKLSHIDKKLMGGFMDIKRFIAMFLFLSFMIFPIHAIAAKGAASDTQLCMACHADKTLNKKLMSKEILSLYINGGEFGSSVHGRTGCSGCHPDINMQNHPRSKKITSKAEYAAGVSRNCSRCHTAEQLKKRQPIHSSLAAKGTCVGCHGSHYIRGMAAAKVGVKENAYCLTCHRNNISMPMKNGESLSVTVDASAVANSVHGKLQCTDCHAEFSKAQHPIRSFSSRRAYTIAASEGCRKCHEEADKLYATSVHLDMLKGGNLKAPTCSDCHGDHSIASVKRDRNLGITSCNKCHSEMNSSYEASIHGKAWQKGVANAPSCSSCHNAHNIDSTALTTKIKDGCLKCHKDAGKLHSKWLANPPITLSTFAAAHFDGVSCAACHAKSAGPAIYLSLYNRMTGKPLSAEEAAKSLGTDPDAFLSKMDKNANGSIDAQEMWTIFADLLKKGIITTFIGKMDVRNATEAHMIGGKADAVKDCEKCHRPGAELFQDVFIVVKNADGKPATYKADNQVLTSVFSILPVSKFYALGSMSITLLDILFVVALIGGLAVPIGHISLRIITSPLRSLRRMGKGGKK